MINKEHVEYWLSPSKEDLDSAFSIFNTGKYVWALKDINFEVKDGEIIGIIGRNGAGKSTLIRIMATLTSKDSGKLLFDGQNWNKKNI